MFFIGVGFYFKYFYLLWNSLGFSLYVMKHVIFPKSLKLHLNIKMNCVFRLNIPVFVGRLPKALRPGPHCEILIIKGFGQSISWSNLLHPGCSPMGFQGSLQR